MEWFKFKECYPCCSRYVLVWKWQEDRPRLGKVIRMRDIDQKYCPTYYVWRENAIDHPEKCEKVLDSWKWTYINDPHEEGPIKRSAIGCAYRSALV